MCIFSLENCRISSQLKICSLETLTDEPAEVACWSAYANRNPAPVFIGYRYCISRLARLMVLDWEVG